MNKEDAMSYMEEARAGGRYDYWEIFKLLGLFFAGYIIGRFS